MLAPIDKIERNGNDILPIDITRRCNLNCSNCTRFLPFRNDARDMSLEVFRKAVEYSVDWPGVIVLIGGNPCLHPQFDNICKIMEELLPQKKRGLWTNDLCGRGEIAKRTFWPNARFNLNSHGVEKATAEFRQWLPGITDAGKGIRSHHASLMGNHKEIGVDDAEWEVARERCDYNQDWSASIVERNGEPVVYFCEVGAFLDDAAGSGDRGVKLEPGWWRWRMDRFQHQVAICNEACLGPLRIRGHTDADEVYDMTPSMVNLAIRTQRGNKQQKAVHMQKPGEVNRTTQYIGER